MKTETLQLGLQAINACSKAFRWEDALQLLKHMATQKARSSGLLEFIQIQPLFQIILNNPTQEIKKAWIEIVKTTNTSKLYLSLFTVFCSILRCLYRA